MESYSLFCQVVEGLGKCREVGDELSVEITESDEGSDHFDQFRWFSLLNGLELGGVHEHFSVFDYQP